MLPNFLIIGAPRSGTTHLYQGLRQHPGVFMSDFKEPMYYACDDKGGWKGAISDKSAYEALFNGAERYAAAGEASTLYLYSEKAPERIRQELPSARLVAILRNPVDRAFSQYTFQRFLHTEPFDTFEAALAAEEERKRAHALPFLFYRQVGLYGEQIPRYLSAFSKEQLLFLLQDDLDSNPEEVFRRIFSFIGVDPEFQPDLRYRTNASGVPQHSTLFHLIKFTGRAVKRFIPERMATRLSGQAHKAMLARPRIADHTRQQLQDFFRDDILRTQALIGCDLSQWLN